MGQELVQKYHWPSFGGAPQPAAPPAPAHRKAAPFQPLGSRTGASQEFTSLNRPSAAPAPAEQAPPLFTQAQREQAWQLGRESAQAEAGEQIQILSGEIAQLAGRAKELEGQLLHERGLAREMAKDFMGQLLDKIQGGAVSLDLATWQSACSSLARHIGGEGEFEAGTRPEDMEALRAAMAADPELARRARPRERADAERGEVLATQGGRTWSVSVHEAVEDVLAMLRAPERAP